MEDADYTRVVKGKLGNYTKSISKQVEDKV